VNYIDVISKFILYELIMVFLCGAALEGRPSAVQPSSNNRHCMTITPEKRNKAKQALPVGQEKQGHKNTNRCSGCKYLSEFLK
jgi:hypothetical protein